MSVGRPAAAALVALAGGLAAAPAFAGAGFSVFAAAAGNWSVPGNWDDMNVPNVPGEAAVILGGQTATLDIPVHLDRLGLAVGATVNINNNVGLSIRGQFGPADSTGTLSLQGLIRMNSVGNLTELTVTGGAGAYLLIGNIDPQVVGVLELSNNSANRIYGVSGAERMIFQGNTRVRGAGQLGVNQMAIENAGEIRAIGTAGLFVDPNGAGMDNRGVLSADGGPLTLANGVFRNFPGSFVSAFNSSVVNLSGARLENPRFTTSTGGVVRSFGSTVVNGMVDGEFEIPNNSNLTLEGTLTCSSGAGIRMLSVGNLTDLILAGDVTVSGQGDIRLSNNIQNRIYSSTGSRLTLGPNGVSIRGSGQLGLNLMALTLVPGGTVVAEGSAGLTIDPNAGGASIGSELRAAATGVLTLNPGAYAFSPGARVVAGDGGVVQLAAGASLSGGRLEAEGDGMTLLLGCTLTNVRNLAPLTQPNNNACFVAGTITNDGTIRLLSVGNLTDMILGADTLFDGAGTVQLSNNLQNRIYASSGVHQLTVGPQQTFRGAGQIGVNLTNIVNHGLIEAAGNQGLTIDPAPSLDNNGVLRAAAGATLTLNPGTFDNTGAVVESHGVVAVNGATLFGGTLTTPGAGEIRPGGATLRDLTSTGRVVLANNASFFVAGVILNQGALVMQSVGNLTDLILAADTTFGGSGVVELSNNIQNRIYSGSGTRQLTVGPQQTIRGAGQIGVNLMNVVNNGLIEAAGNQGLTIDPAPNLDNNGTLRAAAGSTLVLTAGQFDNTGAVVEARGVVAVNGGATLFGGTLTTPGAGEIRPSSATLRDLTSAGRVALQNNNSLSVAGTIVNQGTLLMQSVGNLTDMTLTADTLFSGGGVIELSDNAQNRIYSGSGPHRLTVGPQQRLRGAGQVGVNLIAITNQGLIEAMGGQGLTIDAANEGLVNTGTIRAPQGTTLTIAPSPLSNQGLIESEINAVVRTSAAFVQDGGVVRCNGFFDTVPDAYGLEGGVLEGSGFVQSSVTNTAGVVRPGAGGFGPVLTIQGVYTQQASGFLEIGLQSANVGTRLAVTGSASLGGTLRVTAAPGFTPALGTTYTVLTTAARVGEFTNVQFVGPPGLGVEAQYDPGLVRIVVVPAQSTFCVADIVSIGGFPPPDGELTVDDYTSFINAFASDDLLADVVSIGGFPPPDGELTVDDYTSFINSFAEGCGG